MAFTRIFVVGAFSEYRIIRSIVNIQFEELQCPYMVYIAQQLRRVPVLAAKNCANLRHISCPRVMASPRLAGPGTEYLD